MPKQMYKRKVIPRSAVTTRVIARQEVKKAIKKEVEVKCYDGILALTEVGYDGLIYGLYTNPQAGAAITQEVGNTQYIGGKITPVAFYINGVVENVGAYNTFRIVVIQARGASPPTTTELLQSTSNIRTPFCPYDRNNRSRYRVLYDKMMILNPIDSNTIKGTMFNIAVKKNLKYTAFSNSSGTPEDGGIYVYFYSDESTATVAPNVTYYSRIFYSDA